MAVADGPVTDNPTVDLTAQGPDSGVRIVAVHIPTPVADFDKWRDELATAEAIGRTETGPTWLIGDLNSSHWHPDFRRLLNAGFVDAHAAAGSGFPTSWPTIWPLPPFVRQDSALTAGERVNTDFEDFSVPGSDHLGMIVTVAPARRVVP